MRRLVRAFAGRTYHIVGNLIPRLNYYAIVWLGWIRYHLLCQEICQLPHELFSSLHVELIQILYISNKTIIKVYTLREINIVE